jgi:peptidyl-prolyl cis-trans isomerase C
MSATGWTAMRQEENAVYRYHLLRVALEHFQRNLAQLDDNQLIEVRKRASKTFDIESLVLGTPEAREVVIDGQHLDAAISEVSSRYPDTQSFHADLTANGLDETALRNALYRELVFDAVLQRIGSRRPSVNDIDARLYYELNRDRFRVSDKRTARQILVTINPDYPDNNRVAAQARIGKIAATLANRPGRFAEQARRYSECPTALDGGKLGEIGRGQLFPQLDAALFELREGEISKVIETEMGFHLLLCEKIQPARQVPYARAAADIHTLLDTRHRRNCQKTWLSELVRKKKARGVRNDA